MRVGMTNAGGANAYQDITRSDARNFDLLLFQRRIDCSEANGFHSVAVALWATFGITQRIISRVARRTATRLQKACYPSFTKYLPGSCFTNFFNSSRRSVDETVLLGSSAFVAISSMAVSVSRIAS